MSRILSCFQALDNVISPQDVIVWCPTMKGTQSLKNFRKLTPERRLQNSNSSVTVLYSVNIYLGRNNSYKNASIAFSESTVALKESVSNGRFNSHLQNFAKRVGSTSLVHALASPAPQLVINSYIVVTKSAPVPTSVPAQPPTFVATLGVALPFSTFIIVFSVLLTVVICHAYFVFYYPSKFTDKQTRRNSSLETSPIQLDFSCQYGSTDNRSIEVGDVSGGRDGRPIWIQSPPDSPRRFESTSLQQLSPESSPASSREGEVEARVQSHLDESSEDCGCPFIDIE